MQRRSMICATRTSRTSKSSGKETAAALKRSSTYPPAPSWRRRCVLPHAGVARRSLPTPCHLSAHLLTGLVRMPQIVLIDAKPSVRKQILRELQIMHDCHSGYIISFYGAFLSDPNICICMEFMAKGSLDGIYKRIGAIDIDVVAVVAVAVLE